jgi:hypothetical protein
MTAAGLTAMHRFLIPYFQAGHALFNSGLFIAFVYHGWNGWRTPHFLLGIAILILFLGQIFLGLGVLL